MPAGAADDPHWRMYDAMLERNTNVVFTFLVRTSAVLLSLSASAPETERERAGLRRIEFLIYRFSSLVGYYCSCHWLRVSPFISVRNVRVINVLIRTAVVVPVLWG